MGNYDFYKSKGHKGGIHISLTKRIFSYILGLVVLSFGITCTIKAGIGTGAWDALNVGLSKHLFTVGTWVILVGFILILINAILLKAKPDFFAILSIVIVGLGVDSWLLLLTSFSIEFFIWRYLIFGVGVFCLTLGIAIYLQANFAPVPIDNLMIAIHKRFGLRMGAAKTVGELLALTLAIVFKGPIGVGTIIVTFAIGPLLHFLHPLVQRIVK
ncbi:YczE/YyaS/YitT family protein [Aquibacillus salsiterrae]|uniref:Membrane protein n=1 Tax=Aquibacillus salsiterrae TaxID=2950439 RepID=A0A9X4AF72_9BACI|nr:membrane protein [Aquibacillus salsiterrae]MDC3417697.1 membrane protein [Aquibacillus salsiterrae]